MIFNEKDEFKKQLEKWTFECTKIETTIGDLPDFYVIVIDKAKDGIAITNLDRPTIVIVFENEKQFKKVLKHELMHLIQHKKGYMNENEAYLVEEKED
jgi:Zn-dependent peptidase ImmA (M78 family)